MALIAARRRCITTHDGAAFDLSIVIPALNEEHRLPATLDRLHQFLAQRPFNVEIVVVSNGSVDRTDDVVREHMGRIPNLKLLSLPERGKGIASKVGALTSRGDVVLLCDADLSMPPEQIDRFLETVRYYDVVAGSREAVGARRYAEPWHRHLMGRVFNRLVQLAAVSGIDDTQCGFKAFRRAAADDLFRQQTLTGFGFDVELLYLARRSGYTLTEIPIDWYFDADTRVRPGIDSLDMMLEVLLIRWRDLMGRYGRRPMERGVGETHA